ncbi:hypothetical protein HDU81_005395 [Chytriomyces hyalinus]|nr:hypothetical protein HDU81_005395 [Chytriomyces hyalinus]
MPAVNFAPRAITWTPTGEGSSWAYNCDWTTPNMDTVAVPANLCAAKCLETSGCTHFSWNNDKAGTCLLKAGPVAPESAVSIGSNSDVAMCGYVTGTANNGSGGKCPAPSSVVPTSASVAPASSSSSSLVVASSSSSRVVPTASSASTTAAAASSSSTAARSSSSSTESPIRSSTAAASSSSSSSASPSPVTTKSVNTSTMAPPSSSSSAKESSTSTTTTTTTTTRTTTTKSEQPSPTTPAEKGLNLKVVNNCKHDIWPGMTGDDKDTKLPFFGDATSANPAGFQLKPGAWKNIKMKPNLASIRLWARLGCKTVDGKFVCDVGDCGNPNNHFDGTCYQGGGLGANSLFEISIDADYKTWYDLSIVDGYTIPIAVALSGSPVQIPDKGKFSCGNPSCNPDMKRCPPELIKYGPDGSAIACQSISKAINDDATRKAHPQLNDIFNNPELRSKTECSCIVGSCAGDNVSQVLGNLKNGSVLGKDRSGWCCSPNIPWYSNTPDIKSHICYADNKPKPLNGGNKRYDQIFKEICEEAYSWEFDDENSTCNCLGTDVTYTVSFC